MKTELHEISVRDLVDGYNDGGDEEKLKWFETINIAGERLTRQELRNAVYSGPFVTDAKRYFSRQNCAAYKMAASYMDGSPLRQDYLETALTRHTSASTACAQSAGSTSNWRRWRLTTSSRGAMAATPSLTTARCSAATATATRAQSRGDCLFVPLTINSCESPGNIW